MSTLFIDTLAAVMGVVMSLGYYPQAWSMWRNKSAVNVSRSAYFIFATGTTIWFTYGLIHNDWVISSSFAFGVVGSWLVLALTFVYGKPKSQ